MSLRQELFVISKLLGAECICQTLPRCNCIWKQFQHNFLLLSEGDGFCTGWYWVFCHYISARGQWDKLFSFLGIAGSLCPANLSVFKRQFKSRINESDYLVEKAGIKTILKKAWNSLPLFCGITLVMGLALQCS